VASIERYLPGCRLPPSVAIILACVGNKQDMPLSEALRAILRASDGASRASGRHHDHHDELSVGEFLRHFRYWLDNTQS
jgi:hypothetical protein